MELLNAIVDPKALAEVKEALDLLDRLGDRIDVLNTKTRGIEIDLKGAKDIGDTVKKTDELVALQKKLTDAQGDAAIEAAKLREQIRLQALENKALAQSQIQAEGSLNRMRAELRLAQQQYDKMSASQRDNTEEGKRAKEEVNRLTAAVLGLEEGTDRHQRKVGNYTGALKVLEDALADVRKKMDDARNSQEGNADVLEALEREEHLLAQLVEANAHGFSNMTKEVKANQRALQDMAAQGLQNTEAYKQLERSVADAKDEVGDLSERLKNMGSDTKTLDGLIQAGETLTAVYGAGAAAQELLGTKSEEFETVMRRLTAVQTLLASLQTIRNNLQQQSSLMLLVETVRTKALALAQWAWTAATAATTAAMRVLRTALLATGLGVFLVLLGSAAQAAERFGDSASKAADDEKKLNDELQETLQNLEDVINATERARNARGGGADELRREIQLLRARGATDKEIHDKEQELRAKELENIRVRRVTYQMELEDRRKKGKLTAEAEQKLNDTILQADKDTADKRTDIQAASFEYSTKIREKQAANAKHDNDKAKRDAEQAAEKQKKAAAEAAERAAEFARLEGEVMADIRRKYSSTENDIKMNVVFEVKQEEAARAAADATDAMREELIRINEGYRDGLLTVEEYEAELADATERGQQRVFKVQADAIRDTLKFLKAGSKERVELEYKLHELELDAQTEANAKKLANDKKYAEERKTLNDQLHARLRELETQTYDVVEKLIQGQLSREAGKVDKRLEELEREKEGELKKVDESLLSEEEKEEKKRAINEKAQREAEALQKRKDNLQRQAAEFERIAAVFRVSVDTAQKAAAIKAQAAVLLSNPVTAALAPLALSQLPIVIASGALAVASILAAPAYAKGTNDTGPERGAVMGEEGTEAVVQKDGKVWLTANRATYYPKVAAHSKVITNDALMKLTHSALVSSSAGGSQVQDDRLLRDIKTAVSNSGDKIVDAIKEKQFANQTSHDPSFAAYIYNEVYR